MPFKQPLLAAAAIVTLACAPAAQSWTNPGNYTFSGTIGLTSSELINPRITDICDVTLRTVLDAGLPDTGRINSASISSCRNYLAQCSAAFTTANLPWTIDQVNLDENPALTWTTGWTFRAVFSGRFCILTALSGSEYAAGTPTSANYAMGYVSYPAGAAAGCATGQERTRIDFYNERRIQVTSTRYPFVGYPWFDGQYVGISGFLQTSCVSSSLNPERQPD